MRAVTSLVLVAAFSTTGLAAQTPTQSFEVVSIKPNKSDPPGVGGMGFAPGGIRARNQSPVAMLEMALSLQPDQIVDTSSWGAKERFDINARVAQGQVFNPMTMFGPMLLSVLTDRFQLKTHHETREVNVYRLVRVSADRLGPKLAQASANACAPPVQTDVATLRAAARGCSAGPVPGGLGVHGMPIATLTSLMAPVVGRVIVDGTGLTGNWDLDLTFVNPVLQSADGDGPSPFTALEEQLGLKLVPVRAPVDVIVIDRLERPSED